MFYGIKVNDRIQVLLYNGAVLCHGAKAAYTILSLLAQSS